MNGLKNSNNSARIEVILPPSYYEMLKSGKDDSYCIYHQTVGLPREGSRSDLMRKLKVGDIIVFMCSEEDINKHPEDKRDYYRQPLEKKITNIETNEKIHQKTFKFS